MPSFSNLASLWLPDRAPIPDLACLPAPILHPCGCLALHQSWSFARMQRPPIGRGPLLACNTHAPAVVLCSHVTPIRQLWSFARVQLSPASYSPLRRTRPSIFFSRTPRRCAQPRCMASALRLCTARRRSGSLTSRTTASQVRGQMAEPAQRARWAV
eukprot:170242-Chlamydomonas_euryale.AAC.11